jgi:hypothetical protein
MFTVKNLQENWEDKGNRLIFSLSLMGIIILLSACQGKQFHDEVTYAPLPTYTLYPTYTPGFSDPSLSTTPDNPSPIPTFIHMPEIRLQENFEGSETCVEMFDLPSARGSLEEGVYLLEVSGIDEVVFAVCQTLVAGDIILEVDARVIGSSQEGGFYYGLVFRVSGMDKYAFVIGSEGGYCAYYSSENVYVPFTNSTDFVSPCWALPPPGTLSENDNHLRVVAISDRIDIYLNDELLGIVRDNRLHEGWVGFVVATSEEGFVKVAFDNLMVTRP